MYHILYYSFIKIKISISGGLGSKNFIALSLTWFIAINLISVHFYELETREILADHCRGLTLPTPAKKHLRRKLYYLG